MPVSRPPIVVIAPIVQGIIRERGLRGVARGLARVRADVEIRACPMADGGEGTLDAVLSRGGERHISL
jgi:glycerate kinase